MQADANPLDEMFEIGVEESLEELNAGLDLPLVPALPILQHFDSTTTTPEMHFRPIQPPPVVSPEGQTDAEEHIRWRPDPRQGMCSDILSIAGARQ